ncbi:AlbA family DNA-binding domain-containing protein [Fibrella forsythiae]|uniref:ATP-binding protein n=1 Tax=Fibrella forsythiae TaxID=2817061 RepID=A0ABS3JCC6_9BACT|nr:ATP-binding protein [Fibrella forsythiae]MBO0947663.1 ATP-binding protein [Fibrella forsythiae]
MAASIPELIARGEGIQLEFKSTLSTPYRIARTLTAFSNTSGGTLLIGIADDGKIVGIDSEYKEMEKIERATDFLIEPPIDISYETRRLDGKTILLLTIPESSEKPHTALDERGNRTIYVRQRDKSVPTNHLMLDLETVDKKLIQTPMVKNLLQFLRKHDSITAERLGKLVNISDYRATKLLRALTTQGILLMVDKPRPARYSLK